MRAAEPMGLDFMEVFTEMMSEAVAKRQVLTDCIDYCGTHEADFLLVSEISRLGRSLKIIVDTLDKQTSAGVDVFSKLGIHALNDEKKKSPWGLTYFGDGCLRRD